MTVATPPRTLSVRALKLGERIETRGLERDDAFSQNPLAFRTPSDGIVMLFRFGAAVFVGMTPVEEEDVIRTLGPRIFEPFSERETETVTISIVPGEDEPTAIAAMLRIKADDPHRLLLVGEALAVSVALAEDERRIVRTSARMTPVAASLAKGKLPPEPRAALLAQIGEALLVQQRLADRVDLDDKPDVLWDHPELERFWAKLVEEYDLTSRANAIHRKLTVIRETAGTITDLISTRTGHRLEWLIVALILIEIVLSLYDRLWK